jgi:hypothetical protein
MFGAKTVLAGLRLLGNPIQGRNMLNKELRPKQVFINLLDENVFQNPLILRQSTRPPSVSLVPHADPRRGRANFDASFVQKTLPIQKIFTESEITASLATKKKAQLAGRPCSRNFLMVPLCVVVVARHWKIFLK